VAPALDGAFAAPMEPRSPNNITTDIRAHIMGSLGFTRR
jgi:hypothetical protein